jgi:hypothetical protein
MSVAIIDVDECHIPADTTRTSHVVEGVSNGTSTTDDNNDIFSMEEVKAQRPSFISGTCAVA